ncbi:MAG: hypothetical protein WD489_08525, partial [Rhodovibrionaceae bacterium]
MSRRLITFLVLLLLLLLLLAGGLYLFRLEAATALLKQQLAARGVEDPELRVTEITLEHATIEAVRLGAEHELRIGRLGLSYDWRELGAGRLREIAIEDAVVKLDLTGESPPLGSLQTLIETLTPEAQERPEEEEEEEGGASGPPIPPIAFTGGRIEALTPEGPIALDASGIFALAEDGRMTVTARVAGEGAPGRLEGEVEAELIDGRPTRLLADLTLMDFVLPRVTARDAVLHLDFSERALAIDLDLRTAEGSAILSLFAESGAPLFELWPAFLAEDHLAALAGSELTGQGAFTLKDFTLPGVASDANADLVFDLALRDGALHLDLPDPARLSARIAPAPLRQAGLPGVLLPAFSQPLSLSLTQRSASPSALILQRKDAELSLRSNLDLHLDYSFDSTLAAELQGEAALSEKGELRFADFPAAVLQAEGVELAGVQLAQGSYRGSLRYSRRGEFQAAGALRVTELNGLGYSLAQGSYQGRIAYSGGGFSATGELTAQSQSLTAGGVEVQDARLEFPVDVQGTFETARFAWQSPARLTLGGLGELPLEAPEDGLVVTSESGEAEIAWRDGL